MSNSLPDLEGENQEPLPLVKDEYVDAFIEAAAVFPQQSLGVEVFSLRAILNNPPANWAEFEHSQLSNEQIAYIGKVMTNAHKHHAVRYTAPDLQTSNDPQVTPDRLRGLWRGTRNKMLRIIRIYIYPPGGFWTSDSRMAQQIENKTDSQIAQEFFDSTIPHYKRSIEHFRLQAEKLSQIFYSDKGKELLARYREVIPQRIREASDDEEKRNSILGEEGRSFCQYFDTEISRNFLIGDERWINVIAREQP